MAGVQRGARGDDARVSGFSSKRESKTEKPLASSPLRGLLFVVPRARCATVASHASLFRVFLSKRRRVSPGGGP